MAQINPNQLSIKQMEKVIEIYKEWYYQSEPIVRVNDEHSDDMILYENPVNWHSIDWEK